MRSSDRQILVPALLASVLIHAVLLVSVVVLAPVRNEPAATAIDVVMKRMAPSVEPVAVVRELEPVVPRSTVKPTPAPVRKAPSQTIMAVEHPAESSVPSISQTSVAAASPPAREAVGTSSQPVETGNGSALRAEPVPADSVSEDDKADFRRALAVATLKVKSYPRLAKERGWEGMVDIAILYKANSVYPEVSMTHSSGRSILDEQAMDMVKRAVRATPVPAGLRGHNFGISLPIRFSLEDE